ncbi:MAG TPA: hypothetical protein VG370_04920 [Chloroflexota bacterium]|jgi:hypothetical protein|nr:hypothetical protein [Chloroflexota bacterium]
MRASILPAGGSRVPAALVLRLALYCAAVVLLVNRSAWPPIESDGFYYLTVARNFVETGRFTYDQIHTTTGFHWAWMGVLVLAASGVRWVGLPLDTALYVQVAALLNVAAYAGAMVLGQQMLRPYAADGRWATFLTLAVFLEPGALTTAVLGMETALLLLALLLLGAALRAGRPGAGAAALSLAVLTRTEALLLYPLYWLLLRRRHTAASLALPPAAAAATLVLNRLANGTWLNNAAVVKRYWAQVGWEHVFLPAEPLAKVLGAVLGLGSIDWSVEWALYRLFVERSALGWVALPVLAATGWLVLRNREQAWRGAPRVLADPAAAVLGVYAVVTFVLYKTLLFRPSLAGVPDYEAPWYYVPVAVVATLSLGAALLVDRDRRALGGALLVGVVCLGWAIHVDALARRPARLDAPAQQCEPAAPDAAFAVPYGWDLAYYRRVREVVADGVVTGRNIATGEHYPDALRAGRAGSYLQGLGVAYVDPFLPELLRFAGGFATTGLRPVVLCGFPYYYLTPLDGARSGTVGARRGAARSRSGRRRGRVRTAA